MRAAGIHALMRPLMRAHVIGLRCQIAGQRDGDPMQFHTYELRRRADAYALKLKERLSTDMAGVAACLGLQVSAKVDLVTILHSADPGEAVEEYTANDRSRGNSKACRAEMKAGIDKCMAD